MARSFFVLGFSLVALVGGYFAFAAGPVTPTPTSPRVPWTTNRIVGSPEPPPPYKVANPFPNIRLKNPLLMAQSADLGRLFVAEQFKQIHSFVPGPDAQVETFFDPAELKFLDRTPNHNGFNTVYGLAFHPKFADNRFCYICYTVNSKVPVLPDGTRVSRFTVLDTTPPRVDAGSEVVLLTFPSGGHNGGDLHFGPDGMLYIATGDAADPNPPDKFRTGQDISDLLGSVLRIDVDRRDPGREYAIPPDNPFVGQLFNGQPARGEVWSYGFRNAWRMSFDHKTGDLWVGDVGWELWEMVHLATRGSNHGWSIVEATQEVNIKFLRGPTPIVRPVIEIPHSAGASMTGGYVYRGQKFPELVGKYIFGDWVTKRIWAATITPDKKLEKLEELTKPSVRVVSFGEDPSGEIYFLDFDAGTIHTLERPTTADYDPAAFPRTLSATGVFRDTPTHTVAPGVRPIAITSPQWQDFATAEHFVALPGDSQVTDYEDRRPFEGDVSWNSCRLHFPENGVLVKTISLETERGNPATRKRIETQILHFSNSAWNGYTYAWRDDQTDADLVPADGAEKLIPVRDPLHETGTFTHTWQFGSRSQCAVCHNSWAEYALAFNVGQLNRVIDTPAGPKNQLADLCESGFIRRIARDNKPNPPITAESAAKEPKLVDPRDSDAPIPDRARSYFAANCGHCHRFGGGGAVDFELQDGANLQNEKLHRPPTRGLFDIPNAQILAPGDAGRSVALYRMAIFGGGRMPHLGAELPDPTGLEVVQAWLDAQGTPADTNAGFENVPAALRAACKYPSAPPEARAAMRATAAKLPAGFMRDLFQGYLPQSGERKLGPNAKPAAILALTGDPARGAALFTAARSQCANCHQVGQVGKNIGPDLTTIGKTRPREDILESILEPSKRIDAAYVPYVLKSADGRTLLGTIARKTPEEIVIRAADGAETVIVAEDVEALTASKESLMPSGLLSDFTPQEAADLLAYLASLK